MPITRASVLLKVEKANSHYRYRPAYPRKWSLKWGMVDE